MAVLKDILYNVPLKSVSGDTGISIQKIEFDSRKVKENDAFVAVKGTQVDGYDFIPQAIEEGASAIITEKLPDELHDSVSYIVVKDAAVALGLMASNFYDHPSKQLKVVAVTGTNGKTTTVSLLHQLFIQLGYKSGLLSTVQNKIDHEVLEATHTTPDALQLQRLLKMMVDAGCTHVFMEASSHAIVQERLAGLKVSGAVFTNISHDHLDYHKTFDAYIKAKKKLFDDLPSDAFALVNVDDKRGMVMLQNSKADKFTYSLKMMANYKAKLINNSIQGLELSIEQKDVWFRLIGEFNAYNLLAVYAVAHILGEDQEEILMNLSQIQLQNGRFEQVSNSVGITAIVDYAHTPDALENVLKTIDGLRTGNEKVITVVGCGGNRDASKRPIMAEIAVKMSNKVLLTSDNPRNEDANEIINEMEKGVPISMLKKVIKTADRREAIKMASSLAEKGDIILVAGKGHETYQEIKGEKHHFDDKEVVKEMLNLVHK